MAWKPLLLGLGGVELGSGLLLHRCFAAAFSRTDLVDFCP